VSALVAPTRPATISPTKSLQDPLFQAIGSLAHIRACEPHRTIIPSVLSRLTDRIVITYSGGMPETFSVPILMITRDDLPPEENTDSASRLLNDG
jgi:hypothetical protein